jgi:hypothetical protein
MSSAVPGILGSAAWASWAPWARQLGHPDLPSLVAPGCLGVFGVLDSAPWIVELMLFGRDRLSFPSKNIQLMIDYFGMHRLSFP